MLIPKNRHEYYLAVISGNDYPTFPPKTREEQYLAKLAGRESDVPIPKTPKERAYYNIISDIKFEPENRWQTFVAAANDDSITAPIPITREEIWWANISLSREVIVEYVGTLPATLTGTKAGYLESYKIYGNTVQDGTPSPENPIVPSGCGVRTENLFTDIGANSGYIDRDGVINAPHNNLRYSDYIEIPTGIEYITQSWISATGLMSAPAMCFYDSTKTFISGARFNEQNPKTFAVPSNAKYLITCYRTFYTNIMLNAGSTALPYVPYGYKLPLTSAGQDVDIYLGEVETTRRIKKLVLTGEEEWKKSGTANNTFYFNVTGYLRQRINITVCSHYTSQVNINGAAEMQDSNVSFYANLTSPSELFYVRDSNFTTLTDLESYLAAQYAAGTPVTVWYVLAEPETGIINEPLMKIGDYADTIDNTQANVQIPTTEGTTVIDYNGTPKPDKVELTYKTIKKTYIAADDKVYQDPNGQLLGG